MTTIDDAQVCSADGLRVIVTGGRAFDDIGFVMLALDRVHVKRRIGLIIHGAANGADSMAHTWARINKIPVAPFAAEWERYGKRAGFIRNRRMLEEGRPKLVVAFPGGRGTKMMMEIAREAGVPVWAPRYIDLRATTSAGTPRGEQYGSW